MSHHERACELVEPQPRIAGKELEARLVFATPNHVVYEDLAELRPRCVERGADAILEDRLTSRTARAYQWPAAFARGQSHHFDDDHQRECQECDRDQVDGYHENSEGLEKLLREAQAMPLCRKTKGAAASGAFCGLDFFKGC